MLGSVCHICQNNLRNSSFPFVILGAHGLAPSSDNIAIFNMKRIKYGHHSQRSERAGLILILNDFSLLLRTWVKITENDKPSSSKGERASLRVLDLAMTTEQHYSVPKRTFEEMFRNQNP